MADDDILREIRATREAFAARHNYDLDSMLAELQAHQAASVTPTVKLEPRRITPVALPAIPPATMPQSVDVGG